MQPDAAARLRGRVALISGSMRGIGLAIAERYLAEGATVVLSDLAAPDDAAVGAQLERLGPRASYQKLDVAQEQDWRRAEAGIRARFGQLDVLVNNAGTDCSGAVEALELEAVRRVMTINVESIIVATKTFSALLAQSGRATPYGSSLINIGSMFAMVGYPDNSAYIASKGAVRMFTKSVALEFAKKRMPIRVNCILPAFVMTPLLKIAMEKWVAMGKGSSAQALFDSLAAATPIGRLAESQEIAGAAYFLASDDSSYCTGSELVVDGGWTAQ